MDGEVRPFQDNSNYGSGVATPGFVYQETFRHSKQSSTVEQLSQRFEQENCEPALLDRLEVEAD